MVLIALSTRSFYAVCFRETRTSTYGRHFHLSHLVSMIRRNCEVKAHLMLSNCLPQIWNNEAKPNKICSHYRKFNKTYVPKIFSKGRSNSIRDIENVEAQIYISSPFSQWIRIQCFLLKKKICQIQLYITDVLDVFNLG